VSCVASTLAVAVLLAGCNNSAPKPPATGGGQVINVTPSQSLVTVAQNAPSGATLALADGTYTLTAPLLIDHDLTLSGSGGTNVIVRFDGIVTGGLRSGGLRTAALGYNPVLHVQGGSFAASGVTFAYTGTAQANVAVIEGASVDIRDCTFTGGVTGSDSGIGDGLDLYGASTGTVQGSTFTHNDHAGVVESDTANVAVNNASSTANLIGALFFNRATGGLSGGSFSGNSQEGILLSSTVGDSGGPSPAIDGATVKDNGGNGILYQQGSAGSTKNTTVSGNGQKGVWLQQTAHPLLDGNDIYGNAGDGVAYESGGAGTLSNNHIHDNGDKGVRILGASQPDVSTNQVTANAGEGIAYIGTAAGTLSDNTVTSNGSNGISFVDQSAPSVSGNASLDNGACGLYLGGKAAPSFADNTVTGNLNNICDQRSLAIPAFSNRCTLDNSLNPDPTRYLAVVVEDDSDQPVAGVSAGVTLLSPQGGSIYTGSATTDSQGVALVLDNTVQSWLQSGSYSAIVGAAAGGSTPAIVTDCGHASYPGTIVLHPGDPGLVDVALNVSDGGQSLTGTWAQAGFPWGPLKVFDVGLYLGGASRMLPGSYGLAVTAQTAGDASFVFGSMNVSSSGATVNEDVATATTSDLTLTVRDGGGAAVPDYNLALFRQDPSLSQTSGNGVQVPTVHVTPGDYWAYTDLQIPDPGTAGTYWFYLFRSPAQHLGPAGSSQALDVGGALSASVASNDVSYAAGDTVTITPHVRDAAGNEMQDASYNAGTALRTMSLQPFRTAQPPSAFTTQGLASGQMTVTVTDPSGGTVFSSSPTTAYIPNPVSFSLPAGAAPGTYTMTVQLNVGPYEPSTVTATGTFTVQ